MNYVQSSHAGRGIPRRKLPEMIGVAVSFCLWAASGFAAAQVSPPVDDMAATDPQAGFVNPIAESDEITDTENSFDEDDSPSAEDSGTELESETGDPFHAPADLLATRDRGSENVVAEFYGHQSLRAGDNSFVGPPIPHATDNPEASAELPKPPVAANIDLSEPVALLLDVDEIDIGSIAPPIEPALAVYKQKSLLLLGAEVAPGTSTRLAWSPDQSFDGIAVPTPVLVVNGAKPGPVLCLTAAIHGDELNGIEVVRRVLYDLEPEELSGAVIGVPIVNLQGFRRASRYLPDRRDLNRYFPGNPRGSAASRLAYSFFTEVIAHCDALVDMHTGSFQRTNLPQLRADLKNPKIVELTQGFGSTVVLHGGGTKGTLRRAASDAGIPSVTVEAGEPSRVQDKDVAHSTKGVMTLLNELGMHERKTNWGNREPVYYRSKWVRAESGGVLFSKIDLGDRVRKGQLLGTITDPITNVQTELRASVKGRVLGMALDQFVMPGFAAYRIGIERPESEVPAPTAIDVADSGEDTKGFDVREDLADIAESADAKFDDFEYEPESGFEYEYEGEDGTDYLDVRDNFEDSE